MNKAESDAKVQAFLTPCRDKDHLKDWIQEYLGIDLPDNHIDPASNSSPIEWLWEAYSTVKNNKGNEMPRIVVLSSRDSYKTLSCSILEVLLLVHFKKDIAHMAAIASQSAKAVQYINTFVRKINAFLQAHGRQVISQNTKKIEVVDDNGDIAYVSVIICTLQGANCISPNTVIHYGNGSARLARDVKPGDILRTWDYSIDKEVTVKVGSISYTKKPTLHVWFSDGSDLILSDDHQIFTDRGWIPADALELEDRVTGGAEIYNTDTSGLVVGESDPSISGGTLRFSRFFDTGALTYQVSSGGFIYENPSFAESKEGKEAIRRAKRQLNVRVIGIESLGLQELIDIHIDTDNEHRKSFLANSMKLLHNSEHTDIFCVREDQLITTEDGQVTARDLYDLVAAAEVPPKVLTFNHELGITELKPVVAGYESRKNILEIVTGGSILRVSPDHQIYSVRSGYKTASELEVGENLLILGENNTLIESVVWSITSLPEAQCYDFTVEDNNNFFCENTLVHNCIDEVDVVRFVNAYNEAKFIPGVKNGQFPVTIMTSTRKFAFGLMQKEIDNAKAKGDPIFVWNLLDITERCPEERHKPDEPKEVRYVHPDLPLRNVSVEEYNQMHPDNRKGFFEIEAYKGCATCPLLPVCQTRLAHRPKHNKGALWKPIDFTIGQFDQVPSPDMAEAQILCRKPSSKGLVYPRFLEAENTITVTKAWQEYTGEEVTKEVTFADLVALMHKNGIRFYAGVDWGFRHNFALIISAIVPTKANPKGEWWIFETFVSPDLEFDDQLSVAKSFQKKYAPAQWFADTAAPQFIKTFRKNGMKCKDFKKDIDAGIEAVRGQIINSKNQRRMKIIINEPKEDKTKQQFAEPATNLFAIDAFKNHHFILDAQGNPTRKPDDEEYADFCDAMRYKGQNMFNRDGGVVLGTTSSVNLDTVSPGLQINEVYDATASAGAQYLQSFINKYKSSNIEQDDSEDSKKPSGGGILFDFGDLDDN